MLSTGVKTMINQRTLPHSERKEQNGNRGRGVLRKGCKEEKNRDLM